MNRDLGTCPGYLGICTCKPCCPIEFGGVDYDGSGHSLPANLGQPFPSFANFLLRPTIKPLLELYLHRHELSPSVLTLSIAIYNIEIRVLGIWLSSWLAWLCDGGPFIKYPKEKRALSSRVSPCLGWRSFS